MTGTVEVAVIGAGISGMFVAEQLKRAGVPFQIYEKAHAVGGTWRDNNYPGLHVDVVTRSYEFPFARQRSWSRRYAPGEEIQQYLLGTARDLELLDSVRFGCEIVESRFDDAGWTLRSAADEVMTADVVFCATGFLHRPVEPDFPGKDSFEGSSWHSSRWDHSISLAGKRIGVIGTGSSGIQIVAELGRRGHDVTHFMRTPQWIQVKANPPIRWYEKTLLGVPGMARFWDWNMGRIKRKTDGPESWKLEPGPDRDRVEQQFLQTLAEEVTDPLLRQQLTPTYALGCKRIPKSPDFYRIIQQPNVHPVFGPIQRIEPRGIVDADGMLHELDVIVYATGFDSHAYMRPMKVIGADGVTIDNLWNDSVYSYRGVGLPSMPNFFLLSGPFAPVNSIAVHASLSDEVGFLMKLLDVIRTTGAAYAPTEAATQRFLRDVREAMPATTYASCEDSWYRDRSGLPIVWPFTRQRHHDMFHQLDLEDFERFPIARPARAGHAAAPTGQ